MSSFEIRISPRNINYIADEINQIAFDISSCDGADLNEKEKIAEIAARLNDADGAAAALYYARDFARRAANIMAELNERQKEEDEEEA